MARTDWPHEGPFAPILDWIETTDGTLKPVVTAVYGTAATDPTHAVDSVAGAADVGMAVVAKRVNYDAVGTITPAAGDYAGLQVDELGRLHVAIGPYDPISRIPVVVDFAHHQIHEGEAYTCSLLVSALANNASKDIRMTVGSATPTTRTPHLVAQVVADGAAEVYLYEGGTVTGGTALPAYNHNRNSTNVPGMVVAENPTVSALGSAIWVGLLTGSKQSSGSSDRALDEWDLKASTTYLLRVTSTAAAGIKAVVRMNWYEDLGV